MINYNIPPLIRKRQEQQEQRITELNKRVGVNVFTSLNKKLGDTTSKQ